MKQTMHDRFLVTEKRRKLERDSLIKATQERLHAERLREEANQKLLEAESMLEDAQLLREGWSKSTESWAYALSARWAHPSGFEIAKSYGVSNAIWSVRRSRAPVSAYSVGPTGLYVGLYATDFNPAVYYDSLEAALEWWRLSILHLGRYPEPPSKGLFERLRVRSV